MEIEERHERVVSASLQALCTVVDTLAQQQASLRNAGALLGGAQPGGVGARDQQSPVQQRQQQQVQQGQQGQGGLSTAAALPSKPGFFKATMGSSSPAVRVSTYRCSLGLQSWVYLANLTRQL